jgi:CBS-domain-containing membrane protein
MWETTKPLTCLTAADVMTRDVVRLREEMPLRDAAHRLRQAQISGAPVVDEQGRCVGVLSAVDYLRRAEEEKCGTEQVPVPACPYQVTGRLLTGEEAVICTLAEGCCPLQAAVRPTTGGRHTVLCALPGGLPGSPQQAIDNLPDGAVRRYMTRDVVTAGPEMRLSGLARMMIDAHIHRVIVLDSDRRPVGVVASTDLLVALARSGGDQ